MMTGIEVREYIHHVIDKKIYREFVKFLIQHNAYDFYLYKLSTTKYKIDINRYKSKIPYYCLITWIMGGADWDSYANDSRKIVSLAKKWIQRQIDGEIGLN